VLLQCTRHGLYRCPLTSDQPPRIPNYDPIRLLRSRAKIWVFAHLAKQLEQLAVVIAAQQVKANLNQL